MSVWYSMKNNHQNLPASNGMHNEGYSGDEYKIDPSVDENVEEGDNDELQFVDDPRKGAKTHEIDQSIGQKIVEVDNHEVKSVDDPRNGAKALKSNQTYFGNSTLLRKENHQDDINDSDIQEILEGRRNDLINLQGSVIFERGEFYE